MTISLLDPVGDFHANRINVNTSTASLVSRAQQSANGLPQGGAATVGQVLLLAADLDTTALGSAVGKDACGAALSQAAAQVTAYWSVHDDVLGWVGNPAAYRLTQGWGCCGRDDTVGRLGKSGPPTDQTLYANAISLDCSAIVNGQHTPNHVRTHVA